MRNKKVFKICMKQFARSEIKVNYSPVQSMESLLTHGGNVTSHCLPSFVIFTLPPARLGTHFADHRRMEACQSWIGNVRTQLPLELNSLSTAILQLYHSVPHRAHQVCGTNVLWAFWYVLYHCFERPTCFPSVYLKQWINRLQVF